MRHLVPGGAGLLKTTGDADNAHLWHLVTPAQATTKSTGHWPDLDGGVLVGRLRTGVDHRTQRPTPNRVVRLGCIYWCKPAALSNASRRRRVRGCRSCATNNAVKISAATQYQGEDVRADASSSSPMTPKMARFLLR